MKSTARARLSICLLVLAGLSLPRAWAQEQSAGWVARADIAVEQPNVLPTQAIGLGNGRLGVAVWAADGLTLQLNRIDTLPGRLSPGQLRLPGLKALGADRNFRGRLVLRDGVLEEAGGGITLTLWVDQAADRVVIDLDGLPADTPQRAVLALWAPRTPAATAQGDVAMLAEHWRDDRLPGASGRAFGALAAVRVLGRDAQARVVDAYTVEASARPHADGHLRVVVAAPAYDGTRDASMQARDALAVPVDAALTRAWWHAFWHRAYPLRASSPDGVARYAETLRTLYLFAAAAHGGGSIPGAQAGIADLFSSSRDDHFWDPAAVWFWNTRMQVAANLAAGVPELNAPVFALYRDNLAAIGAWTRAHMGGRPGLCVPETMRFNGNGVEYESDRFRPFAIVTHSCDLAWTPTSNARTLSTGAEVGLWVWRSWLQTRNRRFLEANYPLLAESARFLLAYQQPGADGLLHTAPSNAHETQTDVRDPTTDIAAIRALYPATIAAARLLGRDAALAAQLQAALARTPTLPVVDAKAVASPSPDARPGDRVIAASYAPAAPYRNGENIGLEPVWPYGLVGLDSPLFAIAQRTFALRPFVNVATWSYDPVQAAYLGRGQAVSDAIAQGVQLSQPYPNGMAALSISPTNEFYIEQMAVDALAMSSTLAIQDDDGLVRIGPAVPPGWTMDGTVGLRDGASVSVQAVDGRVVGFTLHGGRGAALRFATPWQGRTVTVEHEGRQVAVRQGGRWAFRPQPSADYRFVPTGETATPAFPAEAGATLKALGRAAIGLSPPCCAAPPGYDPQRDRP